MVEVLQILMPRQEILGTEQEVVVLMELAMVVRVLPVVVLVVQEKMVL
jgi:hypothetical protein